MDKFSVTFARSASKELDRLPLHLAERIVRRIEGLANQPRPSGAIRLQGQKHLWRLRVGDYRVIYRIDEEAKNVDISIIRHRRDVYRDL